MVKNVLEDLGDRVSDAGYNIGFLYISDVLAKDAESLLTALRSVTGVDHWVGSVGRGICGSGCACIDEPALSLMLGCFEKKVFRVFPAVDYNAEDLAPALGRWFKKTDPLLTFVHVDPFTNPDPAHVLKALERIVGGYVAGGLSSSRTEHIQYADKVVRGGVSGVVFGQDVQVSSAISQGCTPFGGIHTITRCDEEMIQELDGRRAIEVLSEGLRELSLAERKKHPPEEMGALDEKDFQGEIHVAFPIQGSDQNDYLVRNITGISPESGEISIDYPVENGERLLFVHRNRETVLEDLSRTLISLRERVYKERGEFLPSGGLYVSCEARAKDDFGDVDKEMMLVREIIGDIPLAGYYAGGEISNNRLYRHTALLILFF